MQKLTGRTSSPAHNQGPDAAITTTVALAQQGDRVAFHRLVDRYQPAIYRLLYYRTRSAPDAEDLTQDVFLTAFQSLQRLKDQRRFKSWLFQIAVNRAKDFFRKKRLTSLFGFLSTDADTYRESTTTATAAEAEKRLVRDDFFRGLQQLLQHLSPTEREVFLLRFFDQLSINEVSQVMKKNENTVKTHLYRAIRKVKAHMRDDARAPRIGPEDWT